MTSSTYPRSPRVYTATAHHAQTKALRVCEHTLDKIFTEIQQTGSVVTREGGRERNTKPGARWAAMMHTVGNHSRQARNALEPTTPMLVGNETHQQVTERT